MRRKFARIYILRVAVFLGSIAIASAFMSGCGRGFDKGYPSYISAANTTVRVSQKVQLKTQSMTTGSPMKFWVNGVLGGDAKVGTIDSKGMYTAPALIPTPSNVVTITSLATNFPQDTPGVVTVNVLNPIPVIKAVTPSSFSEGTMTVTVNGSQFLYGAQIFWNGAPVPTTYVSGTQLAASISAPNPGTFPLYVGNPEPGPANSGPVSEVVGPGKVVLTTLTNAGTSVRVTNSVKIGLTVTGTSNTAVNWTVNGIAGGNAQIGTIVTNADSSVTYTAPAVVPTPNNVVQLTAVSVDDPTVSITQNISVMNPIPIVTSATPMTFNVGPTTVVLNGSNFINGAQVLVNGVPVSTTFNSGAQLTASFSPTDPGNLDLQVLNPSPGPATSTDLIAQVNGTTPMLLVSPEDASRFLAEATFGATDGDIHHLSKIGYSAWLSEQFNTPATLHEPAVEQALILNNTPCIASNLKCNSDLFVNNNQQETYLQQTFWQQAMTGNDQLRQRVKFALTEMVVVSSTNPAVGNMPRGMANYYDVLGADAFGNFRKLLEDVTLSPVMGKFLSMLGNDKGDANRDPDENYAREVMQLFTIGLYQLNPDGTQKLDAAGNAIPTYSNNDVLGLAKVFTGFSWNIPGDQSNTAWSNCCAYVGTGFGEDILPMQSFPNHHSTAEKSFLGVTIPAQGSPDPVGDLKIALDTLFNHPNLPPFFSQQMIQHLVTSNPSPAYVGRVAAVFQDNGAGVRGDMKAVIQAILLDPEARDSVAASSNPQYGKIREPLLRYTEWARAFTAQSRNGAFNLSSTEDPIFGLGEMSLRSPSVFNWFAPGYVPPGTSIDKAGLLAPEMQITDVSTVVGYLNYLQNAIGADATTGPDVFSNYSTEMVLAATPDLLVDRVNLLLMAGEMDSTLRGQILAAVNSIAIPAGDQTKINTALASRVKTAIYNGCAGPQRGILTEPMMNKHELTRRQFLRTASLASMAGMSASPFLLELNSLAAMAQQGSPSDYKALVCIFLAGGNDGHGTVIATDAPSFSAFTTARSGAPGLAYNQADLLPIVLKTPQSGRTFALNPSLVGVQNLFNAGRAAIVANTGTLVAPTTKSQIQSNSVPLPASLYSHFDQTAAWQAITATGGSAVHKGWGGAMADLIASMNANSAFTCISTSGIALFLSGQTSFQLNVTSAGPIPISGLAKPLFGQQAGSNALASILTAEENNMFAKEYEVIVNRSTAAQATLATAMLPAGPGGVSNPPQYLDPVTNKLVNNNFATSLQTVARIIGGRSGLGVSRQIFYVTLGGFDTHDNQAPQHAKLLTQLGQGLEYFDATMTTLGLNNQVTAFTASDFGRTLTANSDGTDHGWGSHHIVTGGAVQGGDMYGQYPVIGSNQANDTGAGRLIPTTSVEQYAGTLARWFGLSDGQIKTVFPNFGNFGSSPYLGLMG